MKIQPQFNIRKAVTYVIVINALQILAVLALAVFILHDGVNQSLRGPLGDVVVVMLAAVVSWGAVMDIREAYQASKMSVKLSGLDETVNQMSDLNIALRAQRHDVLTHLQVVYSLTEMGEYEEANRYIEKVYGQITAVSRTMKTAVRAVNALLQVKLAACEREGIPVALEIRSDWSALPVEGWEMCKVLSNLIDNAMDAVREQGEGRLRIRRFTVADTGAPIPEAVRERLFEAGVTGKADGHGMGLYIVRRTLERAGGGIEVRTDGDETVFSGWVPKQTPVPAASSTEGKETE